MAILVVFLLIFISIAIFLYKNRLHKEQTYLDASIAHLTLSYEEVLHSSHLVVDQFFANTLNQPEVTILLEEAIHSTDQERSPLRQRLYEHLLPTYETMRTQNLAQLQFHLPDGTSFLRFNQPERYGDNLLGFRSFVRIANQELRVLYGFEVGRAAAGFRFIYPLHSRGRHVGSVEVVLTTRAIQDALVELDSSRHFAFLLSRFKAESIFFPEKLNLCRTSGIRSDFLTCEPSTESFHNSPALSPAIERINQYLHDQKDLGISMGRPLAKAVNLRGQDAYVVTFLPLKNADAQFAGYLVAYTPDHFFPALRNEFYAYVLAALFSTVLVAFLLCHIRMQTQALNLERQSLLTMSNALAEGVYSIDAAGTIVRVNKTACQLLGYESEEMLGKIAHDLFHCHEKNNYTTRAECLLCYYTAHGHVYDGEEIFLTKAGHFLIAEVSGRPLFQDGVFVGSVIAFRDIGEHKAAEDALLEANHQLAQAIQRAEHLAEEARAASEAKGVFLANMSHEIRTPMNAIIGMTHLALCTKLTSQQHDYLSKVDLAAKSLLGILNDILDLSKVEAGRIELEQIEFSLPDVLDNVVSVTSMRSQETQVELVLDVHDNVPEYLVGDPLRLGQVLINLVGNAQKFTEQGEIRISIARKETLPAGRVCLHFQVLDTGIGMDNAQLAKLFKPFEQTEASISRRYGGTGLGLTISRHLVAMMGGTLTATSVSGQGSVFAFHVLCGLGPESTPRALPEYVHGQRVVILDDLNSSRRVLQAMCHDLGLRPDGYALPGDALEAMRHDPADFVLLDWTMP
ncbi:MAG: PAS domain S-box protein, partial [Desulfovibrionales bacterium]|nr:PAS domain S-box protein [Desulfovibrionales bacterium]